MKERPILFNGEMVRAILDGRKTQTRRMVKPQPFEDGYFEGTPSFDQFAKQCCTADPRIAEFSAEAVGGGAWREEAVLCPYGTWGDSLWVRETWKPDVDDMTSTIRYRADGANISIQNTKSAADAWLGVRRDEEQYPYFEEPKWRPSIFMPRWASRITLEITDIRVERLNSISEQDAIAEGLRIFNEDNANLYYSSIAHELEWPNDWQLDPVDAYRALWEIINGKGSWDANPWVWVVEFKTANA